MPLSLLYWLLMLLWLASGFWWVGNYPQEGRRAVGGWSILLFALFVVIGLRMFGAPITGG